MIEARILIVDDHKLVLQSLVQVLEPYFSKVKGVSNPNLIPENIREYKPEIVLLDMNFSAGINTGNEGIFWLREIKKLSPSTEVITITAYGEIELAVKAIKNGAYDFLQKPWENEILISSIKNAIELKNSQAEISKLKKKRNELISIVNKESEPILGESEIMQRLKETATKVSATNANILITGENGTGKGLLAKYIHNLSDRNSSPFITVDLGSLPETLFESELFGHKKGAFTDARNDRSGRIQAADSGTLFLDEIANIPVHMQNKLLSVIQNHSFTPLGSDKEIYTDIRLICATNRDLRKLVQENTFREDLYFRINTIELNMPPLRERMDDMPLLTEYYLEYYSNKYGKEGIKFTNDAWNQLISYSWPGNIRELRHHIEKGVILSDGEVISKDDLQISWTHENSSRPVKLEEIEKRAIIQSLKRHGGSIREASDELGVSRQTLYNKIDKYNIK